MEIVKNADSILATILIIALIAVGIFSAGFMLGVAVS